MLNQVPPPAPPENPAAGPKGGLAANMQEFSDANQHDRGDFLEYTGVEPARVDLLQQAIAAGGAEARTCHPAAAPEANTLFQDRCAARLTALGPLHAAFADLAHQPADKDALLPVLQMAERTRHDAQPFIDRPATRHHRKLGDLHLDLIQLIEAYQVIALRLSRGGGSPVMPVQRWIDAATPLDLWLRTRTDRAGWLFHTPEPERRLDLFTRSATLLFGADLTAFLALPITRFDLTAREMHSARLAYNRVQAARGDVQLFTWWPDDPAELRAYSDRHEQQQLLWRKVLLAVQADLAEIQAAGRIYAGWIRSYDYE